MTPQVNVMRANRPVHIGIKTMKNLSIGVLLLMMCTGAFTGCGCGDGIPPPTPPTTAPVQYKIRTVQKPCKIDFTPDLSHLIRPSHPACSGKQET